jgi:hypothetical protein
MAFRRQHPAEGLPDLGGEPAAGIAIELDEGDAPTPASESGVLVTTNADGGAEVTFGEPQGVTLDSVPHDGNLAEVIDKSVLSTIAGELLEGIAADLESRAEWTSAYVNGLELMGLTWEDRSLPNNPNAKLTGVKFPLLLEACIRSQATASYEMLPPGGPVKTQIIGDATPELEAQAERKKAYMNYYLTKVDRGYYDDFDQMLLLVPFCGNGFKKVYRDPRRRRPVAPQIYADDLIVNYNATSLANAERITNRLRYAEREIIRLQLDGFYVDEDLSKPTEPETSQIQAAIDRIDGRSPKFKDGDERHEVYECHCYLDIEVEGLEHVRETEDGAPEPTGLALPYIAHVHKDSRKIIGLYRNWKAGDPEFERQEYFVHYRFLPGMGFYGWGYVQLLGALAKGSTSILQQLIDTGSFANFPAWAHAKGTTRVDKSTIVVGPGQSVEIDTMGMPIRDALMPFPVREPNPALFQFFNALVEAGRRLGATADMPVGDAPQNAPVGTTFALIEQATKVLTTSMRRLHVAMGDELRLLAAEFARDPKAQYPFQIDGKRGVALAADFSAAVDAIPVSDPNVPTKQQRIALAQAKLQVATQFPDITDKRFAVRGMYQSLGVPTSEIDQLVPPEQQVVPLDPVSENMAAAMGRPIRAGLPQNHVAHFISHMAFSATPGLNPMAMQTIQAHAQEHLAMHYRVEIERAIGQPLPPPGMPMPPEIESQVAMVTAEVAEEVRNKITALAAQLAGAGGPGGDGGAAAAVKLAELEYKKEDGERKAQSAREENADQQRRLQAEMANDAAERASKEKVAGINLERTRIQSRTAGLKVAHGTAELMHKATQPTAPSTRTRQ